jgi:hypothetical protein
MTAKFIGNGNGLVLSCNHGAVSFGQKPQVDDYGRPVVHKNGLPILEIVFPPPCETKLRTGQIVRSNIRHYAKTQGWLTVEVDGRQRDFCPEHAKVRKEQLKTRKADAERLKKEARAAREKADRERRIAWLAKLAGWKAKREEKERAKAARAAARASKRAAKSQLAVGASP